MGIVQSALSIFLMPGKAVFASAAKLSPKLLQATPTLSNILNFLFCVLLVLYGRLVDLGDNPHLRTVLSVFICSAYFLKQISLSVLLYILLLKRE